MTAMIRVRKASDNKFFSILASKVGGIEDTVAVVKEGEEPQDVVLLITEFGNIPVVESSNKVLALLETAGLTIAK